MSLSFFIGGNMPFSLKQEMVIPEGWLRLLSSLDSHALDQYVNLRRWHTGWPDCERVSGQSELIDQQTLAEMKGMYSLTQRVFTKINPDILNPIGLHTTWVLDRTFNAAAIRCSEKYVVTVNVATPILIHRTFRELAKLPGFFPHIDGEIVKNMNEPLHFDLHNPSEVHKSMGLDDAMYWAMGVESGQFIQTTPKRVQLINLLTFLSMDIIISHEVAHIVSGHCDYISSFKMSPIQEISECSIAASGIDFTTRMLWEIEADIACVSMLTGNGRFLYQQTKFGKYFELLGISCTAEHLTGLYLLCIEILYEIFGSIERKALHVQAQPCFPIRMSNYYNSFYSVFYDDESSRKLFVSSCCDPYRASLNCSLKSIPYKGKWLPAENAVNEQIRLKLLSDIANEMSTWKQYSLRQMDSL